MLLHNRRSINRLWNSSLVLGLSLVPIFLVRHFLALRLSEFSDSDSFVVVFRDESRKRAKFKIEVESHEIFFIHS